MHGLFFVGLGRHVVFGLQEAGEASRPHPVGPPARRPHERFAGVSC